MVEVSYHPLVQEMMTVIQALDLVVVMVSSTSITTTTFAVCAILISLLLQTTLSASEGKGITRYFILLIRPMFHFSYICDGILHKITEFRCGCWYPICDLALHFLIVCFCY